MLLTLSVRRLLKEKLFSAINIIGLSVGIACFVLIALYLRDELNYESSFTKADRIYRIALTAKPPGAIADIELATNAPLIAPLLKAEFGDEVADFARVAEWHPTAQVDNNEAIYLTTLLADASVFDLFDFTWLAGDATTALREPGSVVLNVSAAKRLFGSVQVIGRTFMLADQSTVKVVGVLADLPTTTHLQFEMLAPIAMATQAFNSTSLENWYVQIFHSYILLKPGASIENLQPKFSGLIARHLDQEAAGVFIQQAMPLRDLHLHSNRRGELGKPGSMMAVSAFAVIAAAVLIMACFNFINLATASAAQRAKEVGVRKAIGAGKSQLVLQFLSEALVMTAIATVLATVLVELSLPAFNGLLQTQLMFELFRLSTWLPLVLLMLVVGVMAGLYPAFYLSAHHPSAVLRGLASSGARGARLRNALVVVQFSAAIALLICTLTLYKQVEFVRTQDAGYERDQVVVLSNLGHDGVGSRWDAMKTQLLAIPGVQQVTATNNIPTQMVTTSYFINYEGGAERRGMTTLLADAGYLETFGIKLLAGQGFTAGQQSYLLSEKAAQQLGWTPQQAIGKWVEALCCGLTRAMVSGVVQDVQYGSIHASKEPVLYATPAEPGAASQGDTRLSLRQIAIKVAGGNLPAVLAAIDKVWKQFHPNQPLTRQLLDEQFNALYQDEERQGHMLTAFAVLAVFIACLGLFGLASYNAQRRTKEIGVRKVMGSSVWNIVVLLTNDFSRLVLMSNLIAWPVAYFAMNRWLENFAYRIDLTPVVFIGSGLIALCIAWVTVGGTAAKAASQKPVLALRYE